MIELLQPPVKVWRDIRAQLGEVGTSLAGERWAAERPDQLIEIPTLPQQVEGERGCEPHGLVPIALCLCRHRRDGRAVADSSEALERRHAPGRLAAEQRLTE